MGIFKAVTSSIGGALADQWLETIEPAIIDNSTIVSYGTFVRKEILEVQIKRALRMLYLMVQSYMCQKMYICFLWMEEKLFLLQMNLAIIR